MEREFIEEKEWEGIFAYGENIAVKYGITHWRIDHPVKCFLRQHLPPLRRGE
jgi:hypothetical protein